ncbi:hypothetical protein DDD_0013 [Nonlabens dokdonensis DSW-6]|uniref:Uncharacterized protein n=1 Tax=Nonlabens dokdonensis (strain DSM 17205 / KCTC 12402 / DSW-6) TaxID=592029 RepID=L7W0V8_NONDD|nr:hypothetical protein DDD_0013 [Nonlabens dokdonensis DSW-6]
MELQTRFDGMVVMGDDDLAFAKAKLQLKSCKRLAINCLKCYSVLYFLRSFFS